MSNYVEIMNRINELDKQRKDLRIERVNEISSLHDYRKKYPYQFADLPGNPDNIEPEDVEIVLGISKYRLKNTDSIADAERKEIINQINRVSENVKRINSEYDQIDEVFINELSVEKAKREEYLEEIYNKTEDLVNQISEIEKSIDIHREGMEDAIEKGYEIEIIRSFENVIAKKQNEIKKLRNEIRSIYSEKGLTEEIELYKEEKSKIERLKLEQIEREKQEKLATEKIKHAKEIKKKIALNELERNIENTNYQLEEKNNNQQIPLTLDLDNEKEQKQTTNNEIHTNMIAANNDGQQPKQEAVKNENSEENVISKGEVEEKRDETQAPDVDSIEEPEEQQIDELEKKDENNQKNEYNFTDGIIPSNDISMYKRKSELTGITDDLIGKWVIKGENGKYINIDEAVDFEPEDAILVLPDNADISRKKGTYIVPDDSQIPEDYKQNEFLNSKPEEQYEIKNVKESWFLEQKAKMKKSMKIMLGIASLAVATGAATLGTGGLSVAIPLSISAINIISSLKSPEREVLKETKRIYKLAKEILSNAEWYELTEEQEEYIKKNIEETKKMGNQLKESKNNGEPTFALMSMLEQRNKSMYDYLDQQRESTSSVKRR